MFRACLRFGFLILWFALPAAVRAEFALRDGDTVVFLGDSITAARTYGKIIENYSLLRFPERRLRFVNAGWGGDTAAKGLARLERDVFARGATAVIVAFGTNDIGWGLKADREHKEAYLQAVRGILTECRERRVRVYLCSAAITGADPATSEESFLQKMCDEGLQLAREAGEQALDVQRGMREIQKRVWEYNAAQKDEKGKVSLHAADGVHLTDLGQLAMAFAILKGLGAPAEVSSATIDAAEPKLLEAAGCKVMELKAKEGGLEFVRLDQGRPLNFGLFGALQFRFVPVHNELNRYMLAVKNLPAGRYELTAGGRLVGTFTSGQLAQGLNIASLTPSAWQPGGLWDAEATILSHLTDSRNELDLARLFASTYLSELTRPDKPWERFAALNAELEAAQRAVAKPVPYQFVVRSVEGEKPAAAP